MSVNNFGISPAPISSTATRGFTPAVIPSPLPSVGVTGTQQNTTQMSNPIVEAAAGPKCNLIWVKSIDEILAYPTSPNEQLYFGNENDPILYVRKTDANGVIMNPLHALTYTMEDIPFGQEAKFVTKDEHRQLYELVEKLSGSVESMNGKLEQLLNG